MNMVLERYLINIFISTNTKKTNEIKTYLYRSKSNKKLNKQKVTPILDKNYSD